MSWSSDGVQSEVLASASERAFAPEDLKSAKCSEELKFVRKDKRLRHQVTRLAKADVNGIVSLMMSTERLHTTYWTAV